MVFTVSNRLRAFSNMSSRNTGRINLSIVAFDGRSYAATATPGALRRNLQPGRGAWTTATEAPSSAARRYAFDCSRLLRFAREPIPSSTSDCIANAISFLRYLSPPMSLHSKEPWVVVVTSSSAIRFPPSAACTRCTGRGVPSADTDTRFSGFFLDSSARAAFLSAVDATPFHLKYFCPCFSACAVTCAFSLVSLLFLCFSFLVRVVCKASCDLSCEFSALRSAFSDLNKAHLACT